MHQNQNANTQVIFLNGPSSSGKSTLAKKLQAKLQEPYLQIGIDHIIEMMPEKLNCWNGEKETDGFWFKHSQSPSGEPLAHIQLGSFAHKISHLFKQVVITALECGHNIIIDEVCVVEGSFAKWQKILSPWNTLYIGIKTETSVLIQREQDRKDRMIGSARAQNAIVHLHKSYDLELNTDKLNPDDCIAKILSLIESTTY